MEILPSLIFLLALLGASFGSEHGSDVIDVFAVEGHDTILPCSVGTNKNIVQEVFDWKKDDQKEVFLYDAGVHYNNGRPGQDEQFKGRVSHFSDQLKFGNASIIIRDTKLTDSGTYTCYFPNLQPRKIFYMKLHLEPILKNRLGELQVACPKPNITIFDVTKDGVVLQCEVQGATSVPMLQWEDSDGNLLPAEEPQVLKDENCYNIKLRTTVTSTATNCFHCVLKQENISHVIDAKMTVSDKLFEDKFGQSAGVLIGMWLSGVLTVAVPLLLFVGAKYIREQR